LTEIFAQFFNFFTGCLLSSFSSFLREFMFYKNFYGRGDRINLREGSFDWK
jgi:hypothetical protein